jgi:hypothetical protein
MLPEQANIELKTEQATIRLSPTSFCTPHSHLMVLCPHFPTTCSMVRVVPAATVALTSLVVSSFQASSED